MQSLIKTESLCFLDMISYPNITINSGETVFISGKSGCGKSTLLKLINNTLSPSGGKILYKDTDINNTDSIKLRQEILLVSQNVFLFDSSIEENFKTFYEYRGMPPLPTEKIKQLLKLCCAYFELTADCSTLSGGERQRVFIAIFLSFNPNIIMLDEPTSALDKSTADELFTNLKRYCKQNCITLIAISHDRTIAEKYADRIIDLEKAN